jgi:hypothetical protein
MDYDDVDLMANAVRDTAMAVLQVMEMNSKTSAQPPTPPQQPSKRVQGKPIPSSCVATTCRHCYADVVIFTSKRTGKAYFCDTEMGYYENKRQLLTGSNWLHKCGGAR